MSQKSERFNIQFVQSNSMTSQNLIVYKRNAEKSVNELKWHNLCVRGIANLTGEEKL